MVRADSTRGRRAVDTTWPELFSSVNKSFSSMNSNERNDGEGNERMIHWSFDVGSDYPSVDVAEVIMELEGKERVELSPMYETIDCLIENLFSDALASDAQAVLQFSYEGYRITLNQDGNATIMEITEDE